MRLPELPHKENSTRQQSLLLTRTDWVIAAVFVVVLVVLFPFAIAGHELAGHFLLDGVGFLMGFSAAELLVRLIGGSKRLGFLLLLVGIVWIVGLLLLAFLPYAEWRSLFFEGGERTPLYLLVGGFVSGLANAGGGLLWGPSTPGEAREWMRAEIRTLAVVAGAVLGLFGLLSAAYVAFWYVLAPLVRFFLE